MDCHGDARNDEARHPAPDAGSINANGTNRPRVVLDYLNSSHFTPHSSHRCAAFTLAEVLITLGIIGVVAALTMPALITKYQKQQTVVQLKKAVSTLEQAIISAQAVHGSDNVVLQGNLNLSTQEGKDTLYKMRDDFVDTYLLPYMKVLKDCGDIRAHKCEYYYYTSLDKQMRLPVHINDRSFITTDGVLYSISGDNTIDKDENGNEFLRSMPYFFVLIDLNESKGPNIAGRDVFIMKIDTNGNASMWGKGKTRDDLKNSVNWGCSNRDTLRGYCGTLIQQDGWQISDDYLWQ